MNAPTTMTLKIPTFPGWRGVLWRLTRGKWALPVWHEFVCEGVEFKPQRVENGKVIVDFTCRAIRHA